jgi:ribosomal protein S18 acetylase RimI-like enzyme
LKNGLCPAFGLDNLQLQQIRELEAAFGTTLNMKLNWDMLTTRATDECNDFLFYANDLLVGFLGLYGFGPKPKEIEITGMVHPDYQRRGIFEQLFTQAKEECMRREAGRILWVVERNSASGITFVKKAGSTYDFSEYRLRFEGQKTPDYPSHGIELRKAAIEDFPTLVEIDMACFGLSLTDAEERFPVEIYESTYLAVLEAKIIGKIRTTKENRDGGVYGFGVHPEYRRLGYGREILSKAMQILLEEHAERIFLEVASENDRALALYKSCGFKEVTVYDYYALPLKAN